MDRTCNNKIQCLKVLENFKDFIQIESLPKLQETLQHYYSISIRDPYGCTFIGFMFSHFIYIILY